jgi:hypothetical protein
MTKRIAHTPTLAPTLAKSTDQQPKSGREWTIGMVEMSARGRGVTAEARLIAVFAVFDDIFNRADREARAFVNRLDRMNGGRTLDAADRILTTELRSLVSTLATEAELSDVEGLGLSWRVLMTGAVSKAMDGDLDSAKRAGEMAGDLLVRHRAVSADQIAEAQIDDWFGDYEFVDLDNEAPPRIAVSAINAASNALSDEDFAASL